jgi:UrcA family protein
MTSKNPQTRTAARIGLIACAAFGVSGVTRHAHAADATSEIPTREVSFAGLNLTKPADVEVLYRRIAAAASQVCDTVAGPLPLETKFRVKRCMSETIARAVADVDAPALTQYYAVKMHQTDERVARRQP